MTSFTINNLLQFAAKQSGRYDYVSHHSCALAQFARANALEYPVFAAMVQGTEAEQCEAASSKIPWTWEALTKRLEWLNENQHLSPIDREYEFWRLMQ